jgi:hypothetical protein
MGINKLGVEIGWIEDRSEDMEDDAATKEKDELVFLIILPSNPTYQRDQMHRPSSNLFIHTLTPSFTSKDLVTYWIQRQPCCFAWSLSVGSSDE